MLEDDRIVKKQPNNEKPISLKPLKFEEAVSDLLKVKPEVKVKKTEVSKNDADKLGNP